MGNCQASEAATVVIQHPENTKVERIYWSVSAHEIMNSNPGHYVAMIVSSPTLKNDSGFPLKQLKLLRPDDSFVIGQVYRLISFEDVLKEFSAKKCGKLGKLLKESGGVEFKRTDSNAPNFDSNPISGSERTNSVEGGPEARRLGMNGGGSASRGVAVRQYSGGGQWKPALQSISETGS